MEFFSVHSQLLRKPCSIVSSARFERDGSALQKSRTIRRLMLGVLIFALLITITRSSQPWAISSRLLQNILRTWPTLRTLLSSLNLFLLLNLVILTLAYISGAFNTPKYTGYHRHMPEEITSVATDAPGSQSDSGNVLRVHAIAGCSSLSLTGPEPQELAHKERIVACEVGRNELNMQIGRYDGDTKDWGKLSPEEFRAKVEVFILEHYIRQEKEHQEFGLPGL